MTLIPFQQISSATFFISGSAPSARPNLLFTNSGPCATSRSHTRFSATAEILTSSAKPLRTWPSGSVRRKAKSRKVTSGAWYAPSRFLYLRQLSPTLMLTEASMSPMSVVGTRMKLEERR